MFSERNTYTDANADTFQTLGVAAHSVTDNLAARMESGGTHTRAAWGAHRSLTLFPFGKLRYVSRVREPARISRPSRTPK